MLNYDTNIKAELSKITLLMCNVFGYHTKTTPVVVSVNHTMGILQSGYGMGI